MTRAISKGMAKIEDSGAYAEQNVSLSIAFVTYTPEHTEEFINKLNELVNQYSI